MKPFAAIILTIALACNMALAGIDGIIYCVEKDSGAICSVNPEKAFGLPEKCCPFEEAKILANFPLPFECDHCTDYEIDASDEGATVSVDRVVVKATAVIAWTSTDLFVVRNEETLSKNAPVRAPPIQNRAAQLFADTVVFRV
ncbi:hypothetical protein QEH56_08750 [Pelagicoccus enzymogenes]|uniref:hypothetical protein n=1 Tax=Pelagicoccus enzymogenes TaxID=2773457 RepID=UPI0028102714|nr:hypothetical protein [Pelagicoccus enzymogenes]MDQ8198232.1 hypothetical protein [Pelagicoccus enzymogenes]